MKTVSMSARATERRRKALDRLEKHRKAMPEHFSKIALQKMDKEIDTLNRRVHARQR